MKTLKNKAKKGFTIVELVIVIAVIAILAAVLIPTFTNVVASANESAAMQESKNEWTNYLVEIATDGEYTSKTYYVVYEKGENTYVFAVVNGEFNTNSDASLDYTTNTVKIQYTYAYSTTSGYISIYAPTSTKDGIAETTGADNAVNAAEAAAAAQVTKNKIATSNDYYVTVNDGTTTYYGEVAYDTNSWACTLMTPTDWNALDDRATTVTVRDTTTTTGYTVVFYAQS